MGRPTDVLTCYRARRRLGAYLDGALASDDVRWTEGHLAGCDTCQEEVRQLRRLKQMVSRAAAVPEPDWTGFWPGIVRGVDDAKHRPVAKPSRRPSWQLWPRWAMGGAAIAAVTAALVFWQGLPGSVPAEAGVLVNGAETEEPGATVMVYTPDDRQMAVVWIFARD